MSVWEPTFTPTRCPAELCEWLNAELQYKDACGCATGHPVGWQRDHAEFCLVCVREPRLWIKTKRWRKPPHVLSVHFISDHGKGLLERCLVSSGSSGSVDWEVRHSWVVVVVFIVIVVFERSILESEVWKKNVRDNFPRSHEKTLAFCLKASPTCNNHHAPKLASEKQYKTDKKQFASNFSVKFSLEKFRNVPFCSFDTSDKT